MLFANSHNLNFIFTKDRTQLHTHPPLNCVLRAFFRLCCSDFSSLSIVWLHYFDKFSLFALKNGMIINCIKSNQIKSIHCHDNHQLALNYIVQLSRHSFTHTSNKILKFIGEFHKPIFVLEKCRFKTHCDREFIRKSMENFHRHFVHTRTLCAVTVVAVFFFWNRDHSLWVNRLLLKHPNCMQIHLMGSDSSFVSLFLFCIPSSLLVLFCH